MLIHGGPQGLWGHSWTYRWNAQVFAAAGYVVVMPNPRGSTGYGQKFIDEINGDWGGKRVRRHHGGGRLHRDRQHALCRCQPDDGGRRVVRRLHDRLDSGPHAALQGADLARRRVRPARANSAPPRSCGSRCGNSAARRGTSPKITPKWSPNNYVKDFHTPTLVIHGRAGFPRALHPGPGAVHRAANCRRFPPSWWSFPTKATGCLKPQNSLLWYKTVHRLAGFLGEKVKAILAIVLLLAVAATAALLAMSTHTALSLAAPVQDHRGLARRSRCGWRTLTACAASARTLEQNGARYLLFEQSAPAHRWWWRRHEPARTITFEAGKNKAPNLKEGPARLVVEAVSERLSRQHRHGFLRCQRGAHRAARDCRQRAALHQPGRHGTGDLHRRRLLERSRREGGQVHLPQLPSARATRTSASPCSPIRGTCRPA